MKLYQSLPLLASLALSAPLAHAHGERGSIGGGVGINYGIIGASFDFTVTDNFSVTTAINPFFDGVGYVVGGKYYFRPNDVMWRPRISVVYGTSHIIHVESYYEDEYERFEGVSIGLGQSFAFGQKRSHGFDFDLYYRATDGGAEKRIDELTNSGYISLNDTDYNKVVISLGYRFNY